VYKPSDKLSATVERTARQHIHITNDADVMGLYTTFEAYFIIIDDLHSFFESSSNWRSSSAKLFVGLRLNKNKGKGKHGLYSLASS